jgi:hypothetical protein
LIFDLITLKERSYRDSIKSKILAWSDNPLLSYEVYSDNRVFWPRQKMVIFPIFNVVRDNFVISNINIVMFYAKRKSIFSSVQPSTFWLSTNMIMWEKLVDTMTFCWKNASHFHIFRSISTHAPKNGGFSEILWQKKPVKNRALR